MTEAFDPDAVPIRPAATVMLVRDAPTGESGIEVFLMRRTGKAAFGAGMYVFPGGRVDGADAAADIERFCRGLDDADASAQLGIDAGGLAFWLASLRECFEEAGVLLAERRDGGPLALRNDDRHAVHDGTLSLAELCARDDLVLDLSEVHYVDHWITPLGEVRRFDTRFFLTEAPHDQVPLHDDSETVDSEWVRPVDALARVESGEMTMMPPTIANLRFLARFSTAAEAMDAGAAVTDPPATLPKLRFDDAGNLAGIVLPGEPGYDEM